MRLMPVDVMANKVAAETIKDLRSNACIVDSEDEAIIYNAVNRAAWKAVAMTTHGVAMTTKEEKKR